MLLLLLLLLPANCLMPLQAVAAYTAQFKADVTAHPEVFNSFLAKLLNYHFILRRWGQQRI